MQDQFINLNFPQVQTLKFRGGVISDELYSRYIYPQHLSPCLINTLNYKDACVILAENVYYKMHFMIILLLARVRVSRFHSLPPDGNSFHSSLSLPLATSLRKYHNF